MTPRKCPRKVRSQAATAVVRGSVFGCVLAAFGCAPSEGVSFSDASVPGSGGMTASSGGAPGSGGAPPGTGGAAPGTGGRGTGGATGSGGSTASGGSGTGTGGRGTGGAGTGTGGAGTAGRGTGGAGTGTGGSSGGGGAAVPFSQVATILGTSCGTGMCHMGGAHVDLRNTAGLRDRIVGKMVSGTMSMTACQSKTYVVAGNTATSVISQIIKAAVTGCGARMPDECSTSGTNPRACLTTAQITTIDNWITGGAPP